MNKALFEKIKKKYGRRCSWAIWDEKDVTQTDVINGVCVSRWTYAKGLASALRLGILDAARAKGAGEGKAGKMERV
jgi:hypothetical protein